MQLSPVQGLSHLKDDLVILRSQRTSGGKQRQRIDRCYKSAKPISRRHRGVLRTKPLENDVRVAFDLLRNLNAIGHASGAGRPGTDRQASYAPPSRPRSPAGCRRRPPDSPAAPTRGTIANATSSASAVVVPRRRASSSSSATRSGLIGSTLIDSTVDAPFRDVERFRHHLSVFPPRKTNLDLTGRFDLQPFDASLTTARPPPHLAGFERTRSRSARVRGKDQLVGH